MTQVTFDANGNPIQHSGFRRTGSGALQYVATLDTTMGASQWRQYSDQLHTRAEQTENASERVAVIGAGSRDVRARIGSR